MLRFTTWLGLIWVLGCGSGDEASAPTPSLEPDAAAEARQSREEPTKVEKVASMEAHYGVAIIAHDALIRGDLPTFRAALIEVSQQELPPGSDPGWHALQDKLQAAAAVAGRTQELPAAAAQMGVVVQSCGTCHVALGLGPLYPAPAPPEGDDPIETAMLEHQWVTERLWEGVTGPWDNAWERGATALANMRIAGDDVDSFILTDAVQQQEDALRALGSDAQAATSLDDRAAVYGRALATCGGCHQSFGVRFDR
jgi:cytochrome c553